MMGPISKVADLKFPRHERQRTLEELDHVFGVPTRRHVAYQVRTWLPWLVRRYVLFDGAAELPSLYGEGSSGGESRCV